MIPIGVSMVVSGGAVSPENRSNEDEPTRPYGDIVLDLDGWMYGHVDDRETHAWRLAGDVPSLLDRIEELTTENVNLRDSAETLTFAVNNLGEQLRTLDERYATERLHADAMRHERDAALARIAAVEARAADVDLIRRAIADPFQFLPRNGYFESIASWSARAVVAALAASPTPTTEEQQ